MNLKDLIGKRGEDVFAYLIGEWCFGRMWFFADFLGAKGEALDHRVSLIAPSTFGAVFYVQVKSTTRGYSGQGAKRKLKVKVSKEDIRKLKTVPGPAFVAGIDINQKVGYLKAVTAKTPVRQLSGIPCDKPINCTNIRKLWREIDRYWRKRNMAAEDSYF